MKQQSVTEPVIVIPFRSKDGRLFVEIDPRIERAGRIHAGEPLTLELNDTDIVFHREPAGVDAAHSEQLER